MIILLTYMILVYFWCFYLFFDLLMIYITRFTRLKIWVFLLVYSFEVLVFSLPLIDF